MFGGKVADASMGVSCSSPEKGISVVTVDFPPVNALPVRGWSALADAVRGAGRDPGTRCVVLAAEGRGFNAGVDIKEIQAAGQEALIGANQGVLIGNADAVVASEDAFFGLPGLDRGALGAATHLARLVPQHLMRTLYFTGRTVSAPMSLGAGGLRRSVTAVR
jgi:enoyl-CoA hydratase